MKLSVIIPAAGSGTRMNHTQAKPFIPIAGEPVIVHTLRNWIALDDLIQVIVPTQPMYVELLHELFRPLCAKVRLDIIEGGAERQDSIANAVAQLDEQCELVAVHDAVRPFADAALIKSVMAMAEKVGAAVPVIPLRDTIKEVDPHGFVVKTPDRQSLVAVQTPQIFSKSLFIQMNAFLKKTYIKVTDDASLAEAYGHKVATVAGNQNNIKLTYPIDMQWAELILKEQSHV